MRFRVFNEFPPRVNRHFKFWLKFKRVPIAVAAFRISTKQNYYLFALHFTIFIVDH